MIDPIQQAIIIPGWSETAEYAWGFANEISSGKNAMVEDVRAIIPVADAIKNPELLARHIDECSVWTHSAGIMAVDRALQIFTDAGPEPTSIPILGRNGLKVSFQSDAQREEGIPTPTLTQGPKEVLRNFEINLDLVRRMRSFSTAKHLSNAERFPEGRAMFVHAKDEHEFTRIEAMIDALEHGVHVDVFPGYHNAQMERPAYIASLIKFSLENTTV